MIGVITYYENLRSMYSSKFFHIVDDILNINGYTLLYDISKSQSVPCKIKYNNLKLDYLLDNNPSIDTILFFNFHIAHYPLLSELFENLQEIKERKIRIYVYYEEFAYTHKIIQNRINTECEKYIDILFSPSVKHSMSPECLKKFIFVLYYASKDFNIDFNDNPTEKVSLTGFISEHYAPRVLCKKLSEEHTEIIEVLDHPCTSCAKLKGTNHQIIGKNYCEYLSGYLCGFTSPSYWKFYDEIAIYPIAKHFEIMASGSLMMTSRSIINIMKRASIYPDVHYIEYEDTEESIFETIKYVLDSGNRDRIDQIRKSGYRLTKQYHMSTDRAEFIKYVIDGTNKGEHFEWDCIYQYMGGIQNNGARLA